MNVNILTLVLRTDLPARLACLLEPFGVSHNACEDIKPEGSDMLITGCGPIGLFAIPIAKQMGATRGKIRSSTRRVDLNSTTPYMLLIVTPLYILTYCIVVIAVDVVDYRLQKAKEVGADVVINAKTKEELYDAIMKETSTYYTHL